ncbi:MAG: class I SAM-dependent methyltransferase, partial [Deltaproteobacteria bacterium]|nr:class I SAM-dependent methyltransferase [Deltaproteobacteria bacterium]
MDINNVVNGHAERFDPAMAGFNIVYEHLHRYAYAAQFVKGKRVLDLACGEGYGSSILAEDAAEVVGIDRDERVIGHAASKYNRHNLSFKPGNIEDIPFDSDEFDVVVCFEAIEHIQGQE